MYTEGEKGGGKGWEEKGKRGRETGKIEICRGNMERGRRKVKGRKEKEKNEGGGGEEGRKKVEGEEE